MDFFGRQFEVWKKWRDQKNKKRYCAKIFSSHFLLQNCWIDWLVRRSASPVIYNICCVYVVYIWWISIGFERKSSSAMYIQWIKNVFSFFKTHVARIYKIYNGHVAVSMLDTFYSFLRNSWIFWWIWRINVADMEFEVFYSYLRKSFAELMPESSRAW